MRGLHVPNKPAAVQIDQQQPIKAQQLITSYNKLHLACKASKQHVLVVKDQDIATCLHKQKVELNTRHLLCQPSLAPYALRSTAAHKHALYRFAANTPCQRKANTRQQTHVQAAPSQLYIAISRHELHCCCCCSRLATDRALTASTEKHKQLLCTIAPALHIHTTSCRRRLRHMWQNQAGAAYCVLLP
jgi:hypothetical protein